VVVAVRRVDVVLLIHRDAASLGRGEDDAGRLVHEIGWKDPDIVYVGETSVTARRAYLQELAGIKKTLA
jgi:hypothetical protein